MARTSVRESLSFFGNKGPRAINNQPVVAHQAQVRAASKRPSPYHVARADVIVTENGNVAVQVAVVEATLAPANGLQAIRQTPIGMFDAARLTFTGPLALICKSGVEDL